MDEFFERPVVWLLSAAVAGLVLLARCDVPEGFDPYCWQGAQPDAAEAAVYEEAMVNYDLRGTKYEFANSLPPTGCYD